MQNYQAYKELMKDSEFSSHKDLSSHSYTDKL